MYFGAPALTTLSAHVARYLGEIRYSRLVDSSVAKPISRLYPSVCCIIAREPPGNRTPPTPTHRAPHAACSGNTGSAPIVPRRYVKHCCILVTIVALRLRSPAIVAQAPCHGGRSVLLVPCGRPLLSSLRCVSTLHASPQLRGHLPRPKDDHSTMTFVLHAQCPRANHRAAACL
jgi:hypothetical protein